MINTNDLIGLAYGWGHRPGDGSGKTDCFQLMCEIRRRLDLYDYSPDYTWVYDKYPSETFDRTFVSRLLLKAGKRIKAPVIGIVTLLPSPYGAALATFVNERELVFIAPDHNVVRAAVPHNPNHLFWLD